MNENDDIILEYLDDIAPSSEPPSVIRFNIEKRADEFGIENRIGEMFTQNTVLNRLKKLESSGLVETDRQKGGYRKITEKGSAYLRGDYDVGGESED